MRRIVFFLCYFAVVAAVLFYITPPGIFLAVILSFLLFGLAVVFKEYKESMKGLKAEVGSRLGNYEAEKKRIEEQITQKDIIADELRNKELMMVSLYELTKNMSHDLTFNEIFDALSSFLREYFIFKKIELLILKEMDGYIKIDRVYKLYKKDIDDTRYEIETDYGDILTLFTKEKTEVYIQKEGGENFGAIPLLSEKKFVGILTAQGLPRTDFDRLVIVAMQFALEMKKVLLYETVEALAITDSLTGLYTRRYFFERLNEELQRSEKQSLKFAFLMIDIDDFKRCNDAHGHLVGDILLKDISGMIKENVREIDLVARYGGEEFSVILPETDRKGAKIVAERIRKKIEENIFKAYDETLKATVSIGLAVYPEDAETKDNIIEKSDRALYAAKNSGKNIVCEYID